MIIPPQKKKKKDIVFENISQFTRKWIEYFCVLGLFFLVEYKEREVEEFSVEKPAHWQG